MSLESSLGLIFGGCCSNVYALEAIVKHEPDSGLLITVFQLFVVAILTLPTQVERRSPRRSIEQKYDTTITYDKPPGHAYTHHDPHPTSTLTNILLPYRFRRPIIPYIRLLNASILFALVNLLNNWAFVFDISVPMHIILRSFGSVITLVVGWFAGKTYGKIQILGVLGLTVGVVMAAWADAAEKGANLSLTPSKSSTSSFAAGLIVLFVAQLLGAVMGVYSEDTYARHGRHWREVLFYTHFFGFVFSLVLLPSLRTQFQRLLLGPRVAIPAALTPYLSHFRLSSLPKSLEQILPRTIAPRQLHLPGQSLALLLLNALTQYLCISGVNQLGAATSAVTVTVVLNVRKLASFMLSCAIFGNELTPMMIRGAAVVFVSGAVYGLGGARAKAMAKRNISAKERGGSNGVTEGKGRPFDSLAIAKGYATPPASPATAAKHVWREVRSSVQGMVGERHTLGAMSELDGTPAMVHQDGTMSPRMARGRGWDGSVQSFGSQSGSPDGGERDGGWATGAAARVNADGSMTRR